MITLTRTNSEHKDFHDLVHALDIDLKIRNGEAQDFFAQFNKIDAIKHVVVAYEGQQPVGCGAVKKYGDKVMEVKRMFVPSEFRGKGIASLVLSELEKWSSELGYERCILETGGKQVEAIQLYKKNNYKIIPNYGQYADVPSSVCFEKVL